MALASSPCFPREWWDYFQPAFIISVEREQSLLCLAESPGKAEHWTGWDAHPPLQWCSSSPVVCWPSRCQSLRSASFRNWGLESQFNGAAVGKAAGYPISLSWVFLKQLDVTKHTGGLMGKIAHEGKILMLRSVYEKQSYCFGQRRPKNNLLLYPHRKPKIVLFSKL